MMFAGIAWVVLAAAYLLFAGQVSRNEIIAGLGASVAAGVYAAVAHRAQAAPLRLRLAWPRVIAAALRSLVVDTLRVGLALLRARRGSLARRRMGTDEAAPGPRAVTILSLSLAPNAFVVRAADDSLLLHRLAPSDTDDAA